MTRTTRLSLALALVFIAIALAAGWIGYLSTDDFFYALAADRWLHAPPFLGNTHWMLRHTIVFPMAVAQAVFGRGEISLAAPMLFYGLGLLGLNSYGLWRIVGWQAGLIAPVLLACIPAFTWGASAAVTDVPEAFYITASLWAFYAATRAGLVPRQKAGFYLLSGMLAGLGFITRETAAALLVAYLLLFMTGYGERRFYVVMAIGFFLITGSDELYLWLMSGDPLWRLHVTLRGVAADSPYTPGFHAPAGVADPFGIYRHGRALQAILTLFASPNIGFLPMLAVPAAVCLSWRRPAGEAGRVVGLFVLLAACWFAVLNFGFLSLWVLARYQMVTLTALTVPAALLLANWFARGRPILAALVILVLTSSSLVLTLAADRQLMFGERALVAYASSHDEIIRTDPSTRANAGWLLENAGVQNRVIAAMPVPGGLYFVNHTPRHNWPASWTLRDTPANSDLVAAYVQPAGPIARVITVLGIAPYLPPALRAKLVLPLRHAEMVRLR
jgi:4-amino-4-deoxy-L-arabinose transferase-like glycosyltransferase